MLWPQTQNLDNFAEEMGQGDLPRLFLKICICWDSALHDFRGGYVHREGMHTDLKS